MCKQSIKSLKSKNFFKVNEKNYYGELILRVNTDKNGNRCPLDIAFQTYNPYNKNHYTKFKTAATNTCYSEICVNAARKALTIMTEVDLIDEDADAKFKKYRLMMLNIVNNCPTPKEKEKEKQKQK